MKRKLSKHERRLVKAKVKDPDATLEELGVQAGYAASPRQHAWGALQKPDVQAEIRALMNQSDKLRIPQLLRKLEEGLDAQETRVFAQEVTVGFEPMLDGSGNPILDSKGKPKLRPIKDLKIKTVNIEDQPTRHKFLNTALELHGAKRQDGEQAASMSFSVLMGQAGSESEQDQLATVLVAVRIQRGLHPVENRPLTAAELKEFKR